MATLTISRSEYQNDIQVIRSDIQGIREDLSSLDTRVGNVERDVAVLKEDVAVLKEDVAVLKEDVTVLKEDVTGLKKSVNRLQDNMSFVVFEQQRSGAWLRNQFKKIPTQRIDLPPVWDQANHCAVFPGFSRFPRSIKEFYALRHPSTSHQRKMLRTLVLFYDVSWQGKPYESFTTETSGATRSTKIAPSPPSGDREEDELYDALADKDTASAAVDALEGILGLSEANFSDFLERARLWEQKQQEKQEQQDEAGPSAPKRKQSQAPSDEPVPIRLAHGKLAVNEAGQPRSTSSSAEKIADKEPKTATAGGNCENLSIPDTESVGGPRSV